jgi:hypothetical protein
MSRDTMELVRSMDRAESQFAAIRSLIHMGMEGQAFATMLTDASALLTDVNEHLTRVACAELAKARQVHAAVA